MIWRTFVRFLVVTIRVAAILLPAASEAHADVAPTPITLPFLFLFFVIPVIAVVIRLLLLGIAWLVRGGRRAPEVGSGNTADSADAKVPLLGFRVRTWLIVLAVGLAVVVPLDIATFRESARRRAPRLARQAAISHLNAIRSCEIAYFAEWDVYVGNQPFTPVANRAGDDRKVPWESTTRFSLIGFAPEESVRCSYSLEGPDWPTRTEGFTAVAHCDADRDGTIAVYTVNSTASEVSKTWGAW